MYDRLSVHKNNFVTYAYYAYYIISIAKYTLLCVKVQILEHKISPKCEHVFISNYYHLKNI